MDSKHNSSGQAELTFDQLKSTITEYLEKKRDDHVATFRKSIVHGHCLANNFETTPLIANFKDSKAECQLQSILKESAAFHDESKWTASEEVSGAEDPEVRERLQAAQSCIQTRVSNAQVGHVAFNLGIDAVILAASAFTGNLPGMLVAGRSISRASTVGRILNTGGVLRGASGLKWLRAARTAARLRSPIQTAGAMRDLLNATTACRKLNGEDQLTVMRMVSPESFGPQCSGELKAADSSVPVMDCLQSLLGATTLGVAALTKTKKILEHSQKNPATKKTLVLDQTPSTKIRSVKGGRTDSSTVRTDNPIQVFPKQPVVANHIASLPKSLMQAIENGLASTSPQGRKKIMEYLNSELDICGTSACRDQVASNFLKILDSPHQWIWRTWKLFSQTVKNGRRWMPRLETSFVFSIKV